MLFGMIARNMTHWCYETYNENYGFFARSYPILIAYIWFGLEISCWKISYLSLLLGIFPMTMTTILVGILANQAFHFPWVLALAAGISLNGVNLKTTIGLFLGILDWKKEERKGILMNIIQGGFLDNILVRVIFSFLAFLQFSNIWDIPLWKTLLYTLFHLALALALGMFFGLMGWIFRLLNHSFKYLKFLKGAWCLVASGMIEVITVYSGSM